MEIMWKKAGWKEAAPLRRRKNPGRTSLSCPDGERDPISGIAVLRLLRPSVDPVPEELKDREVDIYLCTHHNRRPDECSKTHIIYHEVLYPYVLEQIRALARSMRRRKVNSPICQYVEIKELTPEILRVVVGRISVAHVQRNAKSSRVIQIHWRLL